MLEEIPRRGHGATGALRSNRTEKCHFVNAKILAKIPRGEVEYFFNENSPVVVARWNDNGIVTIGSFENSVLPMVKAERYSAVEH